MEYENEWRLFNVDSIFEGPVEPEWTGPIIDSVVASLAYKNFDFVEKRLPFLVECSTHDPVTWQRLIDAAAERYWIHSKNEGVAVYGATDHCGCICTYRINAPPIARAQQWGREWLRLRPCSSGSSSDRSTSSRRGRNYRSCTRRKGRSETNKTNSGTMGK